MMKKINTLIFILGIVLFLIGIYCYLVTWFISFFPYFIILGTILILVSKKKWKIKLSVLGVLIIVFVIMYYKSLATPLKVTIPNGYNGVCRIMYDFECGESVKENGTLILNIPASGLLTIKDHYKSGWAETEYNYIEDDGSITILQSVHPSKRDKNKVSIYGGSHGSITRNGKKYGVLEIIVFNSDNEGITRKELDILIDKEIANCH